jgi:hypothetical protein
MKEFPSPMPPRPAATPIETTPPAEESQPGFARPDTGQQPKKKGGGFKRQADTDTPAEPKDEPPRLEIIGEPFVAMVAAPKIFNATVALAFKDGLLYQLWVSEYTPDREWRPVPELSDVIAQYGGMIC